MSYFQYPQSFQQYNNQNQVMKKPTFHKVSFNPVISQYKTPQSPISSQNYIIPSNPQHKENLFSPITPKHFIFPQNSHSTKTINRLPPKNISNIIGPQKSQNQQTIIFNINNQNDISPQYSPTPSPYLKIEPNPSDSSYIEPFGSRRPKEQDHHPFTTINSENNNEVKSKEKPHGSEIDEIKASGDPRRYEKYLELLKKACKGGDNTDEEIIIKIIENTSSKERDYLRTLYRHIYNENIIQMFQKELNGDFKDAVIGSFMKPAEYDAYCLYEAFKGHGSKELILIEIIGSRTSKELQVIKKIYATNYGETIKNSVMSCTSGHFQKLLLALLQYQRSNSSQPDTNSCANDAAYLFQAGEQKRGTDEETFTRIFTTCSPTEFNLINYFYRQQTGKGLLGAIESEFDFSPDTKELLGTIVRTQVDLYGYYSKRIHDSIFSSGVNNNSKLIRCICSRYLVDLSHIIKAYLREYQHDMLQDIQNDSSNYRKILCHLILNAI